jgi:hypothetical protein
MSFFKNFNINNFDFNENILNFQSISEEDFEKLKIIEIFFTFNELNSNNNNNSIEKFEKIYLLYFLFIYLQNLNSPVIPVSLYEKFIDLNNLSKNDMNTLMNLLPVENLNFLNTLLYFSNKLKTYNFKNSIDFDKILINSILRNHDCSKIDNFDYHLKNKLKLDVLKLIYEYFNLN